MRILADENISATVIAMLRASNHDVVSVREDRPRTPDLDVLDWATQEDRLLITFDTDFGRITQMNGRPAPAGIVLFRMAEDVPPDEKAWLITQNVNTHVEWPGYLWVINIRKRRASI